MFPFNRFLVLFSGLERAEKPFDRWRAASTGNVWAETRAAASCYQPFFFLSFFFNYKDHENHVGLWANNRSSSSSIQTVLQYRRGLLLLLLLYFCCPKAAAKKENV